MDMTDIERTPWPLPAATTPDAAARSATRDDEADAWEVLAWHCCEHRKPDADITVAAWGADGLFLAWWDDEAGTWMDCASGASCATPPTHWSQPEGPL